MPKKDEDFQKKLLATFAIEAEEHVNAISTGLLELEKAPAGSKQMELIEVIFREAHSLKGAARAVNRTDIESICQPLEGVFANLKHGQTEPAPQLLDLLHDTARGLRQLLAPGGPAQGAADRGTVDSLVERLKAGAKGIPIPPEAEPGRSTNAQEGLRETGLAPGAWSAAEQEGKPGHPRPVAGKPAGTETVRVSTLKLDALFRQAEELISAKLTAEQRVTELRQITAQLEARKEAWQKIPARLHSMQSSLENGRHKSEAAANAVEITRLLEVLESEGALARSLAEKLGDLTASAEVDRRWLGKAVDNLLEDAKKLLMLPFSSLFEILPTLVRDLARDQGKDVDLLIQGAEIEIDRRIQEELKNPLIHLLRNCVDHGIEKPAERARKNKPARGTITVGVSQKDAGKVEIVISDDGAGIDLEKVFSAAEKLGVLSSGDASSLSDQEAVSLVFRSGVSTSSVVTDISGRGLGLAIVQEKIEKLGGSIFLESQREAGVTFRIVLPLTLSAVRGVAVRAGAQVFALPAASVERVAKVGRKDIKTVENRETVRFNGYALSLVRLADVLGLPRKQTADDPHAFEQIVILTSRGQRIAFVVDEVLNEQEVLLKGLGSQLSRVRNIAGATALGTGTLVPFLNVPDLMISAIEAARPSRPEAGAEAGEAQEKSILVVEDSITARLLLKNILEADGYQVKTAVDGVDALTTLKTGQFDLVVSDVEMPRMDGFDLTLKIRSDKKLAELPVVLVTALDSRENRERGIDAGANAYIVKQGFDQAGLLDVIRRLI